MRFVILLSALLFAACKGDAPEPVKELEIFETNYVVVDEESHIRFSATQEGVGFTGEFKEFDAKIYFDAAELDTSRVRVIVPMASFDGGNADRNSNVPAKVWFHTKNYPVAMFETQAIRADVGGYIANGMLDLKGRSQPISLAFTIEQTEGRAVMTATHRINRKRWNIGEAPWDTEEYVGLDVMLDIRVVANQAE
jgi:polyisoprenoid-binding protein YceI